MSRPIQEYLNNLVNKSRIYYLDLNNQLQKQGYQCATCHQSLAGKLPWIIGGTVIVSLAVIVGYLWGKNKPQILDYE